MNLFLMPDTLDQTFGRKMIAFADIISALKVVAGGIRSLADSKEKKDAKYDAAILRIYTAASESKIYIAGLKNRKNPDENRERKLTRLWNKAAVGLRKYDKKIADQCLIIGDSISESTSWSRTQIDEARKTVTDIFNQARKLL